MGQNVFGNINVGNPVAGTHAANKGYVDRATAPRWRPVAFSATAPQAWSAGYTSTMVFEKDVSICNMVMPQAMGDGKTVFHRPAYIMDGLGLVVYGPASSVASMTSNLINNVLRIYQIPLLAFVQGSSMSGSLMASTWPGSRRTASPVEGPVALPDGTRRSVFRLNTTLSGDGLLWMWGSGPSAATMPWLTFGYAELV